MDGIGAGIYAFLNRLLIPTGLHHALNNVFWFDTIGLGDLKHFWLAMSPVRMVLIGTSACTCPASSPA